MDIQLRDLERRTAADSSLRPLLLAEYLRAGKISNNTVTACAKLGHLEASQLTGIQPLSRADIFLASLPKKIYLSLGLGALLELERQVGDKIDAEVASLLAAPLADIREAVEELQQLVSSCRIFQTVTIPAILENNNAEIVQIGGYYPLTPLEHTGLLRRSLQPYVRRANFSIASVDRVEITRYIVYYLEAHLTLSQAVNKKPGQRTNECLDAAINGCVWGHDPSQILDARTAISLEQRYAPIIENAAIRQAFLILLGPLLV